MSIKDPVSRLKSFKTKHAFLCMLAFFTLLSCEYQPEKWQNPKSILATTGMIGDIAKNILPEGYDITVLMGPGVDPHLYEAKPRDIQVMATAETILYNGLHLEGKLSRLFFKLKREKLVLAVADGMPENKLIMANEYTHDPHVWLDPFLWAEGVKFISKELMKKYPADAEIIQKKSEKYIAEILATGNKMKVLFDDIPQEKRVLITSHDAFHYFGKQFNIEVKALQGVSTLSEPGIKTVEELTDFIVSRKIPSLFVESSVSSKSMKALKEASKRRGQIIREGGTLYSDAMGGAKSGADTYLKMLMANAKTVSSGLK